MDKKLLLSVVLAFFTVMILNHFWMKKDHGSTDQPGVVSVNQAAQQSGGAIKVPSTQDLYKPLNVSIDFLEQKIAGAEVVTEVETALVTATFSNFGGILKSIDFKDHYGKSQKPLRTIYDQGSYEAEQRKKGTFLLVCDSGTPYFYQLVGHEKKEGKEILTYQTETEQWIIKKTYTLRSESYQIDLTIESEPKSQASGPLKLRLFFAAPFVHEVADDAIVPVIFNEQNQTLEKSDLAKIQDLAWYWQGQQTIFGAEDRYFVNALIKDTEKFVQRAYFKKYDAKSLFGILEGPEIREKRSWTVSFYVGPKVYDHLSFVDERLTDLLSFGWLSWFCKMMLKLLDFIYQYVKNYGVAIIVLTILLRIPFVPLSIYSRRQMEEYQKHQPHIARIRAKYKNDASLQQQEIMQYHKDHQLSPATPLIGCLPLLMQIPILFSLYRVLNNYLDLYQAPFFGWIVDLSAKDPYYVLPIGMGISMIWQQYLAPSVDEKQRVVMWFMAILMAVLFASFPAGLVLYWLMNNLLTIGEDYLRKFFFSKSK